MVFLCTYYHASADALDIAENKAEKLDINGLEVLFFNSKNSDTELIFYPGGKVEYSSYAPICKELSDRGISCALVKMPFNLAFFNGNAAEDIIEYMEDKYSCKNFYIGGHSLGGVMAVHFAKSEKKKIDGIVLLGAYADKNISNQNLRVLSLFGSEDKVFSKRQYEKSLVKLPTDVSLIVIGGGCHSYFGSYGMQKSDGNPTISRERQTLLTADYICNWIKKK